MNKNALRICSAMLAVLMIAPGAAGLADVVTWPTGSHDIVVNGFDWGPAVTKLVVHLSEPVLQGTIDKDSFEVVEHKQIMNFQTMAAEEADAPRTVLDAYTSDQTGARVDADSAYFAIEMAVNPAEGSPFFYDFAGSGHNMWAQPYANRISLRDGAKLKTPSGEYDKMTIAEDPVDRIIPEVEPFNWAGAFEHKDGITMQARGLTLPDDGEKHPLVIWLHGAGEGGDDTNVVLLGNKVVALGSEAFQNAFGGAYVLCPQSPTMWMDNGEKGEHGEPVYVNDANHASIYTEALMSLIRGFVHDNPGIDEERILIGGCSNGGFMTVNMLLSYPDYFRAAYPICEAYADSWISDEELEKIKHIPIWFTYADTDTVVDPAECAIPTAKRLADIGADVRVSGFEKVLDTTGLYDNPDGTPYEYMGHWSWIYMLNNECFTEIEGGKVAIWDWLASFQ